MDNVPYTCLECDSEFFVFTTREEDNDTVSFCPYCGAEMEEEMDFGDVEDEK